MVAHVIIVSALVQKIGFLRLGFIGSEFGAVWTGDLRPRLGLDNYQEYCIHS